MGIKIANGAWGTLAAGISDSETAIDLTTGHGARFGVISSPDFMYVTLIKASTGETEHVKITNRASDALTVVREQDGSSAIAFDAGDRIECRPINAVMQEFLQLSGGTMTGDLTINSGNPSALNLKDTNSRFSADASRVLLGAIDARDLWLLTNNLARVQISADGVVTLPAGQLQFPATQNASSNANTLDDYEEGTWTPELLLGGAAVGMTYAVQGGTYTKIGNRFIVDCYIQLSSKGSSVGAAAIYGLPGVVGNYSAPGLRVIQLAAAFDGHFSALFNSGTSAVPLFVLPAATATVESLVHTHFSDTTQIILGGQFKV